MAYTNTALVSEILLKRGNAAAASTYVGPMGEVIIDESTWTLRVQDGATPGGFSTVSSTQLGLVSGNLNVTSGVVSAAILTTLGQYVQPAIGSTVTVTTGSSHLIFSGAGVVISGTVYQVLELFPAGNNQTYLVLSNLGLSGGLDPGTVVPAGSPILPLGYAIDATGSITGLKSPNQTALGTWHHSQYTAPVTVPYSTTVTLDVSASNAFRLGPITGNVMLSNPINLQDGMAWDILIYQDSVGGHQLTLGSLFKQSGGGPFPGLDPSPYSINRVSCKYWAQESLIEYVVAQRIS